MKIICIGRNYAKHAKELNNPIPEKPVIFMKPDTAVLRNNQDFYYPEFSQEVHYECEVVARISREGKYIQEGFAASYIDGIGLGIDLTARDLQTEAKKKGLPWALAKGFNGAAPVSTFLPPDSLLSFNNLKFECKLNGETRQQGHTADMMFSLEKMIAYVSQFITLKKGDLLFTGTPEGVGEIKVGDHVEGWLEGQKMLDFHVK
ncbi:MAG: fumarylacetoacetate hydrolase family protein [Bacteroidota bacterium]